jgi:hypothetical protein
MGKECEMNTALDLRATPELEDRHVAIRDFLNEARVTPFTEATLRLSDGTTPSGRRPRLVWLIDEISDRVGNPLPDIAVLGVDMSPGSIGLVRLSDV